MKLHLPILLRKAVLACFTVGALYSGGAVVASDLTLGGDDSLTIDYADADSIPDLEDGTLRLNGDTILLLSNCGVGDGKTYTLLTGVSALLDAEGNAIVLDSSNNAISHYFDTTRPGIGFWADATLALTDDGTLQLVRHHETVKVAQTITTRQTASLVFSYYEGISFEDITGSFSGGAIDGDTITLSGNGSVEFSGNTASSSSSSGGAIYGGSNSTIELSENGSVEFSGNDAGFSGGAIYVVGNSTITLSDNGSVTFSGNDAGFRGGAIDGWGNGTITLSDNGSVTFSGNDAGSTGGAIYGGVNSTITLSGNESVEFSGNTASSSGGAIYGDGDITLSGNGSVTFSDNTAKSSSIAHGGAIYGGGNNTITLSGNGSVMFSGNTVSSSYYAEGGAIYGGSNSTIELSENGSVEFRGNRSSASSSSNLSACGGAIYGAGDITLSGNGSVEFSGNRSSASSSSNRSACGGAIYVYGNLNIRNNDSVLFEKNAEISGETYRLRSISAGGGGDVISLSAAEGKSIEFRDSVYITSGSTVNLNADYTDADGLVRKQTGDIIFTGAYTEQHLNELLAADGLSRTATAEEILNSRTTEVYTMTNLYGGRLRVEDGAIYKGYGITAMENSAATVLVKDATLNHARYDLVFHSGTILELKGKNSMSGNLSLQTDSTLSIHVDSSHQNNAALTLSGTLTLGDTVTLCLTVDDVLTSGQAYKLLTGISQPYSWDSSTVQVTSGTTGWSVDFNDLSWVDNTLWLNYNNQPALTIATWTNEAGNRLWDDASVNWEQNDYDYAYKDGVQVIFGDKAAGTVTLVGALSPASVLVNSSKDYIWNADATEGGSLTGSMKLTKDGSGKLTINTSNSYTGGTDIKGGILVANHVKALGEGAVALNGGTLEIGVSGITNTVKNIGNSTLSTSAGVTHALTGIISNSGTLTFSGVFQTSGLGQMSTRAGATYVNASGYDDSTGGFTKSAVQGIQIATGTTTNKNATILHGTDNLALGMDGWATKGGVVAYGSYDIGVNHDVELDDIISAAATKGINKTDIQLNGGILKANAALTGVLTAEGTSAIIADNWEVSTAFSNSGTLTFSGTIDAKNMGVESIGATLIDANGADSLSGFTKDAGSKFTLVNLSGNGSIVDPTAVSIDRNGVTYILGRDGVAIAEGTTHYNNYLVGLNKDNSRHEVELDDIIAAAAAKGVNSTNIQLNGGVLKANAALTGVLTAEGTSAIIADNWEVSTAFSNSGTLSISGTIDAKNMGVESISATLIDANGADSLSGFTKDAGSKFTLVNLSGNGSIVDPTAVSIDRNGVTYILGSDGVAIAEGTTHYNNYLVGLNKDNSRHEVELDDIIAAAAAKGVNSTNIQLNGGVLKANAALTGVLTAEGTSAIIADNWAVSTAFSNSGTLSISGTIDAKNMGVESISATLIDANGADSLSGFTKDAGSKFTLVNLTGNGSIVDPTQVAIDRNGVTYILGRDGVAIAEGTTHYNNYLVGLNKDNSRHEVELDDIIAAAAAKGGNSTNIQLNGGVLKANAALTGVLTSEGTSAINADNWEVSTAFSNSGMLSISGTIDAKNMGVESIGATLIDANGADNLSGFTKDAGSKFTLVNLTGNGSIVDPTQVAIDRNGVTYILGRDGVAIAEGTTHYGNYLVGLNKDNSRHEVELDDIIAAAAAKGGNSTNIQLNGGVLKANAALTGVLTSEGTSAINADNWEVSTAFSNSGMLSISGTIDAKNMGVESIGATLIDANGADSLSGFTKDAGSKFTLVNLSGNGSIVDPTAVSIDRNGVTYILGSDGVAIAEGTTHYGNYLVGLNKDNSRHEVELDDIIAAAAAKGVNSTNIQLNGGVLKANATLTGVLTAEGTSAIIADNWEVSTAFSNSGMLSISGTIDAKNMGVESIGATLIDANGADSLSGFTKDAGSKFTLVNLSGNGSIVDPTAVSIDRNGVTYILGSDGVAIAEGTTHYNNYLVGQNKDNSRHEVELDDIISAAAAKGVNSTNIQLNGGVLKANAALTGVLTAEGTSAIIADNWEVSTAFSNSGTLSISGTIDAKNIGVESIGATHIDASGADNLSGFAKDAGSKFTLVNLSGNGSIVDPTQVVIDRNGVSYVLGRDGVAIAEGTTHYNNYLVGLNKDNSRHEVELDDIIAAAAAKGVNSTNIQLNGGVLKANATLTGVLTAEGTSAIIADNWQLNQIISNSGTLSISGSIDASALELEVTEAGRVALSGADVSLSESGFARAAGYSVQLVDGGKTVNAGVSIQHDDYRMRSELVLGEDGVARAGGGVDYSRFFLTGADAVSVSAVDAVSEAMGSDLLNVTMDGGALEVDADITVEASGGSIVITDDSSLRGAIAHADITAAAGDYASDIAADISGGSKVTVNGGEVTLSGANSYTGGTIVNAGTLVAGSDTAFGTGDVELRGGVLELNRKALENNLLAQGGIISGGSGFRGAVVFNGSVGLRGNLSASSVTINPGSVLTLNGSTISVSGSLTLGGSAVLNLNGSDFGDGDVLITFGSLSGSVDVLRVDYGTDSDRYSIEREGNALILSWLEEEQPEKPQPELPAPVLDRDGCDALVQSSWGVFTASHAFVDAIGGQRSSASYVGGGRSVAWVSALGGMHRIDGSATASGSDIDLYGAAVGLENFVTDTDTLGFAVGYVGGDVNLKNSGREMEQEGLFVGVYGSHLLTAFDRNNWLNLKWSAAYGDTTIDGSIGQEEMRWKQDSVQLNGRLEWYSQLNYAWSLNVFAGMEYFSSSSAENESSFSLRVDTPETERVRMGSIQNLRGEFGIGTRYTSGSTTLYGELRYLNDVVRSNPYADINGVRGYGANPGRQGIGVSLGAQQELGGGWSVSASYSLEAMSEATMHSANVGVGLRF